MKIKRTACKGAIAAAFGNRVLQVARQAGFTIERAATSVAADIQELKEPEGEGLSHPVFSPRHAVVSRLREATKVSRHGPLEDVLVELAMNAKQNERRQEVANG